MTDLVLFLIKQAQNHQKMVVEHICCYPVTGVSNKISPPKGGVFGEKNNNKTYPAAIDVELV